MKLLEGFAFQCGLNTMIVDMERGKRIAKKLFLTTYQKANRYDEGVKLWETEKLGFEHGVSTGVDVRGPEFDIYTCEDTRKFYNKMRKNLYENMKAALDAQICGTPTLLFIF